MASSNVRRRPAATAATVPTLLVGLVLVGAVSVAGASVAGSLGVGTGDAVTLRSTSGAERELTVSGTYANTAFYGPAIVDITDAQAIGADGTFERMAVRFADDTFDRYATWQLERVATQFPRVNVSSPAEFAELNTSVADTVLRIVAVLLGCAVAIGAVGLAATLSLGVLERSTELSRCGPWARRRPRSSRW